MKSWRYAEIALGLAGLIIAIPLHADIALTGPATVIVPDDGVIRDFTYTLMNDNGFGDVLVFGLLPLPSPTDIGDPTDFLSYKFGFLDTATCSSSIPLADGASCTLVLQVSGITYGDSGATDRDIDTLGVNLNVLYYEVLHSPIQIIRPGDAFEHVGITVTDRNQILAVPEPSSLGLLLAVSTAAIAAHRKRAVIL